MAFRIPVFVSAPTALSKEQQKSYDFILGLLDRENLERRALGRSDYPTEYPLKEVLLMARRCSGGIILGYAQGYTDQVELKRGTPEARVQANYAFPSPWNQLEAGILFSLKLPLLVFRQDGITGGVFDNGVSDVFINKLPVGSVSAADRDQMRSSIQMWVARVRMHYRAWD